jgi:hypothetical protein
MWIMTPTTRGAEQEVSLTIHAALHRPITLSCEISSEAMRYATTCHRLGRRPVPTKARQASPRDRPQAGGLAGRVGPEEHSAPRGPAAGARQLSR